MIFFFFNVVVLLLQIKDCLEHTALPMDGATLTEALHQRGINVRYLRNVLEFVDKMPAKPQLDHFYVCNKNLSFCIIFFFSCHYPNADPFFFITENRNH